MDKKTISGLLFISSLLLLIAGVMFLVISIVSKEKSNDTLSAALGAILLSNLFSVINYKLKQNK